MDVSTIVPLVASHDYEWSIVDSNVLKYSFNNIMLPDSNVNLIGSNGFFKFKISQKPDRPLGSIINNSAAIYFDFNAPIITNTYSHTLGNEFVEFRVITSIDPLNPLKMSIAPNPMNDYTTIRVDNPNFEIGELLLMDVNGRLVKNLTFQGNSLELQRGDLSPGVYWFEVWSSTQILGKGKLIVQE